MKSRIASLGRFALRALAVLVVAAGITAVAASPAAATPTGCVTGTSGPDVGWVQCAGGTGQYRSVVVCRVWFSGGTYVASGPWVTPNHYSYAECGLFAYVSWLGYQTSG